MGLKKPMEIEHYDTVRTIKHVLLDVNKQWKPRSFDQGKYASREEEGGLGHVREGEIKGKVLWFLKHIYQQYGCDWSGSRNQNTSQYVNWQSRFRQLRTQNRSGHTVLDIGSGYKEREPYLERLSQFAEAHTEMYSRLVL